MSRQSRIRWNAEERAAVVRRAQTLLAEDPRLNQRELFLHSQDCLPKERRREPFSNAVAWLKDEVKKAGPLPGAVKVWRPEPTAGSSVAESATMSPSVVPTEAVAPVATDVASASQPLLLQPLIEIGVQLVTGILADPRVKLAMSGLLRPAQVDPGVAPVASVPAPGAPAVGRGEFVVIAGCSAAEARDLAKEVPGTLEVRFWTSDEPREALLELLPKAEIVIGVADGIPRAVESSLSRLGERYVRHTGGVKGLYRRLAERAMRHP